MEGTRYRMMVHPTPVSVGIPVYNGEEYIERAVRTALGQDYEDLEVVITDNASSDATEEICRSIAAEDTRVHYHRNDQNLGMVGNFDRCLKLSTGTYFKWLAADDEMAPSFISETARALDERPDVTIATGRMPFTDETGQILEPGSDGIVRTVYGETFQWIPFPRELTEGSPAERFRSIALYAKSNLFSEAFYGLYRSDQLRPLSPYGGYLGAEKALLCRLAISGPFFQVDKDLLFRRLHPQHFGGQGREATMRGMDPSQRINMLKSSIDQFMGYVRAVGESSLRGRERRRAYWAVFDKTVNLRTLKLLVVPSDNNYLGIRKRS